MRQGYSMTVRHEIETISFTFISCILVVFVVTQMHKYPIQKFSIVAPITNIFATPTPTPPPIPDPTFASQTSSDGLEKITMKTVETQDKKTYSFTITNTKENTTIPLFTQQVDLKSEMSIPFNTFSPDNSYVFLERKDGNISHFLVFQTNGAVFGNGKTYIDVTEAFNSYTTTYTHPMATGWGGDGLLVINAISSDKQNASFWYEIYSSSFLGLSTYFQ